LFDFFAKKIKQKKHLSPAPPAIKHVSGKRLFN
jgi:hypothetical protein